MGNTLTQVTSLFIGDKKSPASASGYFPSTAYKDESSNSLDEIIVVPPTNNTAKMHPEIHIPSVRIVRWTIIDQKELKETKWSNMLQSPALKF